MIDYDWRSYRSSTPVGVSDVVNSTAEEWRHSIALCEAQTADLLAVGLGMTADSEATHFRRCERCQIELSRMLTRQHIDAVLDRIIER